MKSTKRIATGLLFAATLAVSLIASGGDAYGRVTSGGGQTYHGGGGIITITLPTPGAEGFAILGITWE